MMRTRSKRAVAAIGAGLLAAALAGCSSSGSPSAGSSSSASASASGPAITGTINVLAASSLDKIFATVADKFQSLHPGVSVKFDFAGSDTLAAQITEGAPADVFAAASPKTMSTVVNAGDAVGKPVVFTRNVLEIAVAPGNPLKIASLADLAKSGVKVALCAPSVPCGAASQTALTDANVTLTPVTETQDVASALTEIETGNVDASIVYHTDVLGAGSKVTGVDFPQAQEANAINTYEIAVVKDSKNQAAAQAFEDYVNSAAGQAILQQAGFLKP